MRILPTALFALAALMAATGCSTQPATPGERVAVVTDVEYYPACGNEILHLDGTTYYPLTADDEEGLYAPSVVQGSGPHGYSRGTANVVAPGPGDDTGTVIIYSGGYAFFYSDSGDLEQWLTTEEREYAWVC